MQTRFYGTARPSCALSELLGDRASRRVDCDHCTGPSRRTFSITRDERGIVGHCFRCGFAASERGERRGRAIQRPTVAPVAEVLGDRWRAFWRDCAPIRGTVGEFYLRHRGCVLPPAGSHLRFAPRAWHGPTRTERPALVALLTDAVDGAPRSLHFTFLQPDGSGKAKVEAPRLLLARHRKAGTVCRLWPNDSVTTGLCIAEGVETALAAAHAFTPAWAAIDAGNLSALPLLAGVQSLTVCADHDPAGLSAAEACAARWADAGREVRIVKADRPGADLADLAAEVAL